MGGCEPKTEVIVKMQKSGTWGGGGGGGKVWSGGCEARI